jgi:hypothetical protein
MGIKFDAGVSRLVMIDGQLDLAYVQYDAPGVSKELSTTTTPLDLLIEQEDIALKESVYKALSSEAKQVIEMVLNAPAEILSVIASQKKQTINKIKIERMMSRQWKDKKYARKVIKELEDYAKVLNDN